MPHKNGLEVVKEVKKYYRYVAGCSGDSDWIGQPLQEPTYIFLTAFGSSKVFRKNCHKVGVKFIFEKPLRKDKLKTLLMTLKDGSQ